MIRENDSSEANPASNGSNPARFEVRHSASDAELSRTVTRTVSAVTGTKLESLRPLYEVIDPDALNRLFEVELRDGPDAPGGGRVTFSYEQCTVQVHADGRVVVTLHDESAAE